MSAPSPPLCPPRSPRGRGPVLLPAERVPDSPLPAPGTCSPRSEGGKPRPLTPRVPPTSLSLRRPRAQAPPRPGARRPAAGLPPSRWLRASGHKPAQPGATPAAGAAPAAAFPYALPKTPISAAAAAPTPTPPPRLSRLPRAPPPAGEQRDAARPRSPPAALTCCRAASSISASGGRIRGGAPATRHMEARRGGGSRAAPSSPGARLVPAERGEGSGGEGRAAAAAGGCGRRLPRLPEPAAAALAAGCRSSSWAATQRGKRDGERERGGGWVKLSSGSGCFFSLPSPLRGAEGGQGRGGGGWANKRLGDKKEVVAAAAAARPGRRRRLPSAGCFPHARIVPAWLLPPVPPSELGQAAPLSGSARARQPRRCSGPSPAACSPRTFPLPLSSPPSTPPPARRALR